MNKILFLFRKNIFLIIILGIGFFLRVYWIGDNPPSLNWDEVSHGYNAFSILKTGADEWGVKFPLIFKAYGDYKLPLYIYLTVPFVAAFGLIPLAIRSVSILSGVGLIIVSYLLAEKSVRKKSISLFVALLTAVSPWSLFLSRVAVEANLGAFLFALGMYFLICWLKDRKTKNLVFCFLWWGLSLHAYNSARLLVPVFFLTVFLVVLKKRALKQLILPALILLMLFLPISGQFLDKSGRARFELVSLLDQGAINSIVSKRSDTKLPPIVGRLTYNRLTYFLFYSGKNYLSNLSPRYLFFRGGSHYQFSQPDHELLYLVTAPFLILGLLKVFLKKELSDKLLGIWFLLSFIPSAVTLDAPHVLRSILILPVPMVLSGIGIEWITERIRVRSFFRGNLILVILVISVVVSFVRWWKDYLEIYPKAYSWAWQYGYKEAVEFVKDNYQDYDRIYFTKRYGEPHEFILFYFPWNPGEYQKDPDKKWDHHANWYWVDGFDKFIFINDWEMVGGVKCEMGSEKCLLVTSPGNYPERWNKIKTINFLDGKPALEILESD